MKCFRATFSANASFAVDNFAFLDCVPTSAQRHLPVKLTIDKSFRENLKLSKTANFSAIDQQIRPSTPSRDYQTFADELQRSCMSTPGNKFDDSGWASNSNSFGSFETNSTLCGVDEVDHSLDAETTSCSSPSFEGITITEPLFTLSYNNPDTDSSAVLSEPDVSFSFVTIDGNDSAIDNLQEWSMADLPSSWQAVADNLELDSHLLPMALDNFDDVDVAAADINDIVSSSASHDVNSGLDYYPEVSELLAYVGE